MLKDILNLKNVQALNKKEQQTISGGIASKARCYGGDRICCGTANWQCGVGPFSGGIYNGHTCDCF
ncbi:hypothetical protein [Aquimarina sp. 2201CG5-10]|uniref:hypothetical protein n=1 Tax=Aquimarina callyspongiae TaxID=3098150 RepID=UPI002AB46258|nr:hypothetical protein [Aquimarina sp. 2201CG5-10]MDY8136813.1 hypothetical protein [Aquimarina sp. 2201CG5-10]